MQMDLHDEQRNLSCSRVERVDLLRHVQTVAIIVDHLLQPANLSLHLAQPRLERIPIVVVMRLLTSTVPSLSTNSFLKHGVLAHHHHCTRSSWWSQPPRPLAAQ